MIMLRPSVTGARTTVRQTLDIGGLLHPGRRPIDVRSCRDAAPDEADSELLAFDAVSAFDVRDIAEVAAAALVEDGREQAHANPGPRRSIAKTSPRCSEQRWTAPVSSGARSGLFSQGR